MDNCWLCNRPGKYMIGCKEKEWGPVCGSHDISVGVRNLQEAYGLPYHAAKAMEKKIRDAGRW